MIRGIPIAALALMSAVSSARNAGIPPAQLEMVEAERAFVRLAAERGFRDSFYAYFAEDGIAFGPHPFKVRPTLKGQPSAPGPMGAVWAPVYGDISQSGDFGWNTGPLVFEGNAAAGRPDRHGMFFSVWKKLPDATWRVVLDLGSDTPTAVVPLDTPYQTSYRPARKRAPDVDLTKVSEELLALEREFLAAAQSGVGAAYAAHLADDARVHRPGAMPVVGKAALRAWAGDQKMSLRGEPLAADVARSGDLGYSYGSFEQGGAAPLTGYFARVWKRDANGRWRIVMDTIQPLPAGGRPLTPQSQKAEEHYAAQDWAAAAAAYQEIVGMDPGNAFAWNRLGSTQIYLKQYPQAIGNLEKAIQVGGGVGADFYNLACAYALAGQAEPALTNIEKAIAAGLVNRRQYETDGDLASLREDPRFKALIERL